MADPLVFDIDPFADPPENAASSQVSGPVEEPPPISAPRPVRAGDAAQSAPSATPATLGWGDGEALADALFAAGYRQSAIALARAAGTAASLEYAHMQQRVIAADESLAERISSTGLALIPAVQIAANGEPRFTIVADGSDYPAACRQEHGATGVLPELRRFLDGALAPGDVFADAEPGLGFAPLGAATCGAAVHVVVVTDDAALKTQLRKSARVSGCAERVGFVAPEHWEALVMERLVGHGLALLHAGDAGNVAPLLSASRTLLREDRIGVVAWRCGVAGSEVEGTEVAAAVLGVLGFSHFALVHRDGADELVPTDVVASYEYVFSVAPSFIDRSAS